VTPEEAGLVESFRNVQAGNVEPISIDVMTGSQHQKSVAARSPSPIPIRRRNSGDDIDYGRYLVTISARKAPRPRRTKYHSRQKRYNVHIGERQQDFREIAFVAAQTHDLLNMRTKPTPSTRTSSTVQAAEVSFELHTLGWRDFQNLCGTILREVWGQNMQSFCSTHDGGRDGAFTGTLTQTSKQTLSGRSVIQCKFSAKAGKYLDLADIRDELEKARRLACKDLANNYILMTNCRLTATTEAKIRTAFESVPRISQCLTFGLEYISAIIRESQSLRMLVPRVYGLGDLSQILDGRAYEQARQILSDFRGELAKFVITEAFQKSVNALKEHNFVLLLGEPASGKSTIAKALALAAADQWSCQVVKVRDAQHFEERWNPHEPKQFYWMMRWVRRNTNAKRLLLGITNSPISKQRFSVVQRWFSPRETTSIARRLPT
jgi:hypothetical protein